MELLRKFFNDNSTVIGLCDLGRRTRTSFGQLQPSRPITIITGNMKKIISSAVSCPQQNFFVSSSIR